MRRREPTRGAAAERPKAPRWIWNSMEGIKHFGDVDADGRIIIGGNGRQRLAKAREEWCRTKGCWRPGTKTCEQAGGRRCGTWTPGGAGAV